MYNPKTSLEIVQAILDLKNTYQQNDDDNFLEVSEFETRSIQLRPIHLLKIGKGSSEDRRAIFIVAGIHGDEIMNPDLLLHFATKLCEAYATQSDLQFGTKTYSRWMVKILVEQMDIFLLPLANPDAREKYFEDPPIKNWRKNLRDNQGSCFGVDVNRNFDFLWGFDIDKDGGIQADNPCWKSFRGTEAGSEPETKNIEEVFEKNDHISCYIDIHSYGQVILMPWGDDEIQTENASMNFMNLEGPGGEPGLPDDGYAEYMPEEDRKSFVALANQMIEAIAELRGTPYTLKTSFDSGPKVGTSKDWAYARHFMNPAARKVFGLTLETGDDFVTEDALSVIDEVCCGLIKASSFCLCTLEFATGNESRVPDLEPLRQFRDRELMNSDAGSRYVERLGKHTLELMAILEADPDLRAESPRWIEKATELLTGSSRDQRIEDQTVAEVKTFMRKVQENAEPALAEAIEHLTMELDGVAGLSVAEALRKALGKRP
ncbi:MAG: M14 family zinc carboxypeptidase [Verrucomicrobiota bacterium]